MTHRYKTLVCQNCNHSEYKSRAIVRSACSLSVLYYDNPRILTISRLHQFIGECIPINTVRYTIMKHFPKHSNSIGRYYENYGLPYYKIKDKFQF